MIPSQSNKSLKNSWWNILLYWNTLKFVIYLWKIWKKLCLTKYVILLKVHNPLHNRYIYFFFRSNLLDATLIHPESYELAEWLLTSQGFSTKDIGTQNLRTHFRNQISTRKKGMHRGEHAIVRLSYSQKTWSVVLLQEWQVSFE